MNTKSRVAVCSRSFSNNQVLRAELLARYAHVTFNETGKVLHGDVLIEFLSGHDKAITSLETIDDAALSKLPELAVISKYGVGARFDRHRGRSGPRKALGLDGRCESPFRIRTRHCICNLDAEARSGG